MNATEMGRAEETAVLMIYKTTGQETALVFSALPRDTPAPAGFTQWRFSGL